MVCDGPALNGQTFYIDQNRIGESSLVAQWLGVHLPVQGMWVQSLVWEDPTCHGATKPVHHNY